MLLRLIGPIVVLFFSFLLQSCGVDVYSTHVRDYRIFIDTEDQEIKDTISELIATFNADYGVEVLRIVDDKELATSFVQPTPNLLKNDGKLGYGQARMDLSVVSQQKLETEVVDQTYIYSMGIRLDFDNVKKRTDSRFDKDSGDWAHLYHLFCHEVGHGMGLDHTNAEDSVMYYSIGNESRPDLNYESFFRSVREW